MSLCCAKVGVGGALLMSAPTGFSLPPFPFASSRFKITYPSFDLSHQQILTPPRAKRKPSPAQQADELLLDDDFKNSINELSTEAVRTMLSDDMKRMDALREKLLDLELYFEKEKEEDALQFVLVISSMLDHRILPEAKQLKGIYIKAFQKICNIVEDSGWLLKGDENEVGVEMVDDELIPPTLMSEYQ